MPPPPPRYRPFGRGPVYRGGGGCFSQLLVWGIIIAVFAIMIISGILDGVSSGTGEITKSTVVREALPAGSVTETAYYTDTLGWIGNETTLLNGLRYFYQKTGVQPHVYITDNVNGSHSPTWPELEGYANALYDELFTDEAHLLLVFFEYNNGYKDWYVTGTQAKTVIDTEAADILLDYLDRYYYDSSMGDEEYFARSFRDAADRIMEVTTSPWVTVLIVLGVVALVVVLYIWWRHAKKQKDKEAKQTEDMLNTPLEQFGDTEAEERAKKYED